MSAPRCLRLAIEACRPQKTSHVAFRPQFPTKSSSSSSRSARRAFATTRTRCDKDDKKNPAASEAESGPIDIMGGFPMPEPDAITLTEPLPQEAFLEQGDKFHGALRPKKVKHTSTSAPTEKVKSEAVSEAAAQVLQQAAAPTSPSTKPSAEPDMAKGQKSVKKSHQLSKHLEAPAAGSSPSSQYPPGVTVSASGELQANVPANVLAAYRTPLYHPRTHGIPVAQLQLRSFSVRNLEFFADFCVRAAYYLSLPCTGPGPLPKKIERWTVLKSNFINKKAQENFERITLKRLITVYDGAPEVVETWLAFVRRWQFYGVGMKAHVWGWESTDVSAKMDADFSNLEKELDEKLQLFGYSKYIAGRRDLLDMLERQNNRREGMGMSEVREKATPIYADRW